MYEHIHILDWAIHGDEAVPHAHIRKVFDYTDQTGVKRISAKKALELEGFERPEPNKQENVLNNNKITFDQHMRQKWYDICEEHDLIIEREPDFSNTVHEDKETFIQDQQKEAEKQLASETLSGKQFVISGTFALHSRDELKALIENNGGKMLSGVSAKTDYLVAGENMGPAKLEKAQKLGLEIVKHMRERCDAYTAEYNLNFTCLATPAEGLSGRFTGIDKSIYGKLKGITDRDYYTNSFHVPVYYNVSIADKIKLEAPYHALTNGGHITYIELDGNTVMNTDAFESVIRLMKESGIGYGAINHPVDRDPVCGYVGVIGDVCPGCGRKEFDSVPLEVINSLNCDC